MALDAAALDYRALMALVIGNADLRESFQPEIYAYMVDRFVPVVTGLNCEQRDKRLRCTITGRNLSYPASLGGRFSQLGITAARSSLAKPKTDPGLPYQPSWCNRRVMEIGAATLISTDGTSWDGADPLEMFAEQIIIDCGNVGSIDFKDDLLVEVVKDNGNRAGPPGWDVIFGVTVGVDGTTTGGTGTGGTGGSGGQACTLSPAEAFQAFDQSFGAFTAAFPQNPSWGIRDTFQYSIFLGTTGLAILNQDSIKNCMAPADYEANRRALQGAVDNGLAGCVATSSDGGAGCVAAYPGG